MSQVNTHHDVEMLLDKAVDSLAILLGEGPKDELDMHVHMYVDLDRIYGELQDIFVDYLKRTGKLDEHGFPIPQGSGV